MGRQVWVGPHLWRLLNLPIAELVKIYPAYTRDTIKGKRSYWKAKYLKGEIEMPPKPEREPKPYDELLEPFGLEVPDDAQVGFHVGFIKNSEGEIEYTRPLPSVRMADKPRHQLTDFISQADPIRLTPSRRKPSRRAFRQILVFSDLQIDYRQIDGELVPLHDERVISIINMMAREMQPETIVDCSDTLDFASISRFPADSDQFRHSLNPAINRVHRVYAELRADNPRAHIVALDSNHTIRLAKFMMKQVPELYGIRQAGSESQYPALSYPFLVNMEAVGVDWYGGYGAAEYVYGEEYDAPPIVFKHGTMVVSNGSTAAKESQQNPETHVVRGHSHRAEVHHRTTRAGNYLTSMVVGCGCHTDGRVPSYGSGVDERGTLVHHQENWQQSLGVITDYMDGNYQFDMVMINDGVARYNGRVFDGNAND